MRLTDLDATWIKARYRHGTGIKFLCPLCKGTTIAVQFMNPVDGGPASPNDNELVGNNMGLRWARAGMEINELTINPSIDVSKLDRGWWPDNPTGEAAFKEASRPCTQGGSVHWHGFVSNGEII